MVKLDAAIFLIDETTERSLVVVIGQNGHLELLLWAIAKARCSTPASVLVSDYFVTFGCATSCVGCDGAIGELGLDADRDRCFGTVALKGGGFVACWVEAPFAVLRVGAA